MSLDFKTVLWGIFWMAGGAALFIKAGWFAKSSLNYQYKYSGLNWFKKRYENPAVYQSWVKQSKLLARIGGAVFFLYGLYQIIGPITGYTIE